MEMKLPAWWHKFAVLNVRACDDSQPKSVTERNKLSIKTKKI